VRTPGRMHAGTEDASLLERAEELTALAECLEMVVDCSRGRLVLVAGEAGVGKTALVQRFCDGLGGSVRILWAVCDPLFAPRPLGPLLDLARVTDGELKAKVEGGAEPHVVANALLRELEHRAPTVLVLEDVHWADEATLDVLRLVARRAESVPALVVATYRDEQLARSDPLRVVLGELPTRGSVTRLTLDRLSREAVAALSQGSALDADELYELTAGNPFFVTEALAAQTQRVPPTVRDAVLARAARLAPSARSLLEAAAIVPRRVELWLLEELGQLPPGSLDECLSAGMLVADTDGVAFRHELARLAVEESLAPDTLISLNRRALAALSGSKHGTPDLARLAHHAEAAADTEAVSRIAPAAAEEAASVGAHREAADQYARGLRFAQGLEPEVRAGLLERFAHECFLTDMRAEALDALKEELAIHRAANDVVKQGDNLRRRAALLIGAGRGLEARQVALEAVRLLEQGPPGRELARAYAELTEIANHFDDADAATDWGTRAIALAEQIGDTEALVLALNCLGAVEFGRGRPEGREMLERAIRLGQEAGLVDEPGHAYVNLVTAFYRQRDWAMVDRHIRVAIDYCREHGLEVQLGYLVSGQAESELVQGRWSDAAATAMSVLEAAPPSVVAPRYGALSVLALVRARRGDPGYWPLLDEVLDLARGVGELQYLAPAAAARAEACWLEGRSDAIAAETDDAFGLAMQMQEPSSLGELACWRWRAGLLSEPPPAIHDLYRLPITGEWRRAAQLWREQACPYDAALALADADDEAALRQAHDELLALGARPAAVIVARRLRERGARGLQRGPRARTRENPAGLTGRELDVLALLSQGMRNAEIAERLVVSHKTVDHHVSAILRKLDVHTRGEAAAEAVRLGLNSAENPAAK
jgi:DNA-binding CsgD family transcriptional regulator/tetratricopeptide (TPR) repeat protein